MASATVNEAGAAGPIQSGVPSALPRQEHRCGGMASRPNRRASSFCSNAEGPLTLRATVSLHPSPPCLVPSAPLKTFTLGGSGIREARVHTAPQGWSASLSSCVCLGPKTARPGLYVSGKGAPIPLDVTTHRSWQRPRCKPFPCTSRSSQWSLVKISRGHQKGQGGACTGGK